jgi:hypothetical protein
MKPEEIHLSDWMRILVGEVPGSFYFEAIIRVVFIYLLLLVSMRLMGNRMGAVLTLMAPDRGLLPVVVVAIIIISYQRLIAWRAFHHPKFESAVLDDVSILVEDGRLNLDRLSAGVLSRERLLARLRQESISNLGTVQRAYQEANGAFSIISFTEPQPGLCILPLVDTAFRDEQEKAPGQFACGSCGNLAPSQQTPTSKCTRCGEQQWQPAVLS